MSLYSKIDNRYRKTSATDWVSCVFTGTFLPITNHGNGYFYNTLYWIEGDELYIGNAEYLDGIKNVKALRNNFKGVTKIAAGNDNFYWVKPDTTQLFRAKLVNGQLANETCIDTNCTATEISACYNFIFWTDGDNVLRMGDGESSNLTVTHYISRDFKGTNFSFGGSFPHGSLPTNKPLTLLWKENNKLKIGNIPNTYTSIIEIMEVATTLNFSDTYFCALGSAGSDNFTPHDIRIFYKDCAFLYNNQLFYRNH